MPCNMLLNGISKSAIIQRVNGQESRYSNLGSLEKDSAAKVFDQIDMLKAAMNPPNLELWNDYERHTSVRNKDDQPKAQFRISRFQRRFKYYARGSQECLRPKIGSSAVLYDTEQILSKTEQILDPFKNRLRVKLTPHCRAPTP